MPRSPQYNFAKSVAGLRSLPPVRCLLSACPGSSVTGPAATVPELTWVFWPVNVLGMPDTFPSDVSTFGPTVIWPSEARLTAPGHSIVRSPVGFPYPVPVGRVHSITSGESVVPAAPPPFTLRHHTAATDALAAPFHWLPEMQKRGEFSPAPLTAGLFCTNSKPPKPVPMTLERLGGLDVRVDWLVTSIPCVDDTAPPCSCRRGRNAPSLAESWRTSSGLGIVCAAADREVSVRAKIRKLW